MRTIRPRARRAVVLLALGPLLAACIDKETAEKAVLAMQNSSGVPDSLPRMMNAEPPFRYPLSLYDRKVQGNVTLRLFIDSTGRVWPESTVVAEPSGYPALDSAAVRGSEALQFRPASKDGVNIGVRVLFPVFFRHPDASALPGDTVLRSAATATGNQ